MLGKAEEADVKGAAKGIRDLQADNAAREFGDGASQPEQQKVCARGRSGGVGRDVLCGKTEEGGSRETFDAHGGGTCNNHLDTFHNNETHEWDHTLYLGFNSVFIYDALFEFLM